MTLFDFSRPKKADSVPSDLSVEKLLKLSGIYGLEEDAKILAIRKFKGDCDQGFRINYETDDFVLKVHINARQKRIVIYDFENKKSKKDNIKIGLSTDVMDSIIQSCKAFNYSSIHCIAYASSSDDIKLKRKFQGYSLCGLLGFVMDEHHLKEDEENGDIFNFKKWCKEHRIEEMLNLKSPTLFEIIKTKKGYTYWKNHGKAWEGTFKINDPKCHEIFNEGKKRLQIIKEAKKRKQKN